MNLTRNLYAGRHKSFVFLFEFIYNIMYLLLCYSSHSLVNYGIHLFILYTILCENYYCNCILLLYSPLNSYLYVHWILDFK